MAIDAVVRDFNDNGNFSLRAAELKKPIAAVNLGQTRADELLALKVNEPCAQALGGLVEALGIDRPS